jgi:hypothetical protein
MEMEQSMQQMMEQLWTSQEEEAAQAAASQEASRPSHLVGSGRRVGLIGPQGTRTQLPENCWCRLLKKLFQVIIICCGYNQGK